MKREFDYSHLTIGVLALQGDYEMHQCQLALVGAKFRQVRLPRDLDRDKIDALILPGGESTTMSIMLDRFNLRDALTRFGQTAPIFGTCAGMILLAKGIEENASDVKPLGLLDIDVTRNGYGRQLYSFETRVKLDLMNGSEIDLPVSFIRAPRITRTGNSVRILGRYGDDPVLVQQGHLLASAFHSELDEDTRLLSYFLDNFVADRAVGSPILHA